MYSLARFSLLEMTECSAVLRQLGEQSSSLRDVAARTVEYLYSTLGDPDTGARDCVLVRCFKTISYSRLDAATQQIAREKLGGHPSVSRSQVFFWWPRPVNNRIGIGSNCLTATA